MKYFTRPLRRTKCFIKFYYSSGTITWYYRIPYQLVLDRESAEIWHLCGLNARILEISLLFQKKKTALRTSQGFQVYEFFTDFPQLAGLSLGITRSPIKVRKMSFTSKSVDILECHLVFDTRCTLCILYNIEIISFYSRLLKIPNLRNSKFYIPKVKP
jgi:hypothetical protein